MKTFKSYLLFLYNKRPPLSLQHCTTRPSQFNPKLLYLSCLMVTTLLSFFPHALHAPARSTRYLRDCVWTTDGCKMCAPIVTEKSPSRKNTIRPSVLQVRFVRERLRRKQERRKLQQAVLAARLAKNVHPGTEID